MNIYGNRILKALSKLGVMELNDKSSEYAEIYAVSSEIFLLQDYLKRLYEEAFLFTANNIGLSRKESIYKANAEDKTVLQRRSVLLKRNLIKCNCICADGLDNFFKGLSCEAYIEIDADKAYTVFVDITDYHSPDDCIVLENQIRGLFPIGYTVNFGYG